MPVPDSYSRRYGREETTYSSSYSTGRTGTTRTSYLSTYSSKQSNLPPRPPSLYGGDAFRKYGDPSSTVSSRYLSSSSRLRDYGTGTSTSGYRSSVSPVRATSSALRTSISDRLKAIELDGKDDESPFRSYTSRYRNRDSVSLTPSRSYTSAFARDRSNSREYGVSPLAALPIASFSNSTRERDSSLNRSATDNPRKRASPSPTSTNAGSRKDSGVTVTNGQSSSEVNKKSNSSSSTSETSSESATTCAPNKGVVVATSTTTTTTCTDKTLVTFDGNNSVDVRGADDVDNVDSVISTNNALSQDELVSIPNNKISNQENSLGMVMMDNGNIGSADNNGGESTKESNSNSVVVMLVQDKKVKSVPSSSSLKDTVIGGGGLVDASGGGGGEQAFSSTSASSASETVFTSPSSSSLKVMEKDSNGNPISVESKTTVDMYGQESVLGAGTCEKGTGVGSRYGKSEESSSRATISSGKSTGSAGVIRRRRESDSNANNLIESPVANGIDGNGVGHLEDKNKVSIKVNRESSPHESFTISKPRRSSAAGQSTGTASTSSPSRSSSSRVIYHTIKVEDEPPIKSVSPEPVTFTVKAPPPLTATTSTFTVEDNKSASSADQTQVNGASSSAAVVADTSAEFKLSLPRRRSSAIKASDLPSSSSSTTTPPAESSRCNGDADASEIPDSLSGVKAKVNSNTRQTNSPSRSSVLSGKARVTRKSMSPAEKIGVNHHHSPLKNGEDSSSDERSEHEKSTNQGSLSRSGNFHSGSATRKSKSKSPSLTSTSKYLSSADSSNLNGSEITPHSSRFAYLPAADNSTNKNDRRSRYAHLTSADSSDDSDALSSSPQLGGRFRNREGHERAGLTGLRNIGNTCFMNTVLQCLSNTKPLLEYVIRDNYQQDINSSTSGMKGCLIRAFAEVIQELWREQRVVDTSAFKDQIQKFAPRFMGYSQQDAQEFLRYLLEGLHEDVNRVTSKPTPILTDIDDSLSDSQKATEAWKRYLRYEDSRIVDIFVGQLRSTLKCTVCGNCSVTFDPFWDLSLPIPTRTASTRLAQCFELFTKEEVLDGDEKPTCSKCQCRRKCTKSLSIQKFPRILVIHLKRFSPTERYRGKLSTLVDCPLNGLDLSSFAANRGQSTYNLYGVANHSGSTYSGHYIAYCKHPYSGEWHSYNDSRVSPISTHQVVSTEGYVLFYEQAAQSS